MDLIKNILKSSFFKTKKKLEKQYINHFMTQILAKLARIMHVIIATEFFLTYIYEYSRNYVALCGMISLTQRHDPIIENYRQSSIFHLSLSDACDTWPMQNLFCCVHVPLSLETYSVKSVHIFRSLRNTSPRHRFIQLLSNIGKPWWQYKAF